MKLEREIFVSFGSGRYVSVYSLYLFSGFTSADCNLHKTQQTLHLPLAFFKFTLPCFLVILQKYVSYLRPRAHSLLYRDYEVSESFALSRKADNAISTAQHLNIQFCKITFY